MSPDKDVAYAKKEPRQIPIRHGFDRFAGLSCRLRNFALTAKCRLEQSA
jgi:hypothetical protein